MNFAQRLQKLLDYYDLSASGFATKIGIQRSSMSHILSGRNKPSLDFTMKVLHTFPEVSIEWLIDGNGSFPKSTPTLTPNVNQEIETFNEKLDSQNEKKENIDSTNKIISEVSKLDKDIDKIVFFYKDGTFTIYQNTP
ncbi:helix-turn-helix transcriptional regulator [Pseudofulvibacter geojedonensis]|uniref:Helix-turn-helix transcriptional regulator n=1 Tax=Pseudofulvibacter geojedonensis TaxID=1123758 RepID=A0ABW3HYI9_9FLAO